MAVLMKTTGAFASLKSMGDERIKSLDDMLTKGMSAMQVVNIIQGEWGLLKNMQPATLKKTLERYRSSELKNKIVASVTGATNGMHVKVLAKKLSALDEMEQLVMAQKGRFEKALTMEAKLPGMLTKQATDEARLLKEILVEFGRLQLETGVLHRAPKTIKGQSIDDAGKVTTFEWTTEQQELLDKLDDYAA